MNVFTRGFVRFSAGVFRLPLGVKLWMLVLGVVNLLAPLWFFDRLEALFTLAAMFAAMILMNLLTGLQGFTRLLGLGHAPWIPLVAWLATRLPEFPPEEPFGLWLRAVVVFNTVSLVLDGRDVFRYWQGERDEMVEIRAPGA